MRSSAHAILKGEHCKIVKANLLALAQFHRMLQDLGDVRDNQRNKVYPLPKARNDVSTQE
jgi:hypothetical protein